MFNASVIVATFMCMYMHKCLTHKQTIPLKHYKMYHIDSQVA